jgi:hypothetical protein
MAVSIYIPLDPHLVKYMEREAMRRNGTYKAVKTSFFGNHVLGALEFMPLERKIIRSSGLLAPGFSNP